MALPTWMRCRRGRRRSSAAAWALAGALALAMSGCGGSASTRVVSGAPDTGPRPPPASGPIADTIVQGSVLESDVATSELVVAVELIWRPGPRAASEVRRFGVGPTTRFVPAEATLASLRPGDSVQVAAKTLDVGAYQAVEVSHLDLD